MTAGLPRCWDQTRLAPRSPPCSSGRGAREGGRWCSAGLSGLRGSSDGAVASRCFGGSPGPASGWIQLPPRLLSATWRDSCQASGACGMLVLGPVFAIHLRRGCCRGALPACLRGGCRALAPPFARLGSAARRLHSSGSSHACPQAVPRGVPHLAGGVANIAGCRVAGDGQVSDVRRDGSRPGLLHLPDKLPGQHRPAAIPEGAGAVAP